MFLNDNMILCVVAILCVTIILLSNNVWFTPYRRKRKARKMQALVNGLLPLHLVKFLSKYRGEDGRVFQLLPTDVKDALNELFGRHIVNEAIHAVETGRVELAIQSDQFDDRFVIAHFEKGEMRSAYISRNRGCAIARP